MTYSPIIGMKTRMLPVTRPGSATGRVTWRNVAQRPAPRSLDASIEGAVHPLEGHVQREDHQRQVAVDQPDQDRERRPEQVDPALPEQAADERPDADAGPQDRAARRRSG